MKKNSGMHERWKVWREGLTVVGIRPEALVLDLAQNLKTC